MPDAFRRLRVIYPNILKLDYNNKRSAKRQSVSSVSKIKEKTCLEYVMELYQLQNNVDISDEQLKIVTKYWDNE